MGGSAESFNTVADGGNHLTAQDLISRPVAEWGAVIEGRQPENLEMFARNLRNSFGQEFDRLLGDRSIGTITRQFERVREGALYPNGPETISTIPAIQDVIRNSYEKAFGPLQENGRYPEKGAQGDPNYGEEQLRQDIIKARDEIMSTIDQTVEDLQKPEAAPAPDASQMIEAQNQAVKPATLSI